MLRSPTRQSSPTAASLALPLGTFTGRVLIVLLLAAAAFAIWQAPDLLLLPFGTVLLAIGLRAPAWLGLSPD